MLQFILGSSGSGKTTEAVSLLKSLVLQGNRKLLMLVPDQSSFETENTFLDILGPGRSRDVLVLGFSRMCNYVFSKTGNIPQNVIDDGVRKIIMSIALDEAQDRLVMFNSNNTRKSVIDLMLHSLKECKKDNITTSMLNTAADSIEAETLNTKLRETALVLDCYDALVSKTYIDPLDNLNRLKSVLERHRLFEGYTIVVDSFSGFTYQQLGVIDVLMEQCRDMYITVNIDVEYKNLDVFATTNRTRKMLKRLAQSRGLEIKPDIILRDFHRSDKKDISFAEKHLFRMNNVAYKDFAESIQTYTASNIYNEVEFVAANIKSLVVEEGYSYSDIAVICRDSALYTGVLDTALDKYGIPFFMDISEDVYTRPIVRFICSCMDCVLNGFDRDMLLSMMKTGLTAFSETQTADFENYLFVWNIDGADLKKPFTNNPSGFEKFTDGDREKLREIESVRQSAVNPLVDFGEKCKNATGSEISKAVYELIAQYKADVRMLDLYDSLESENMIFEAEEEIRCYNMVIEALDKINATVGNKSLTLKKYREYFEYKMSDITVSDIPGYQDQVTVGTADRIRINNPRAVFIIGAVDGLFPSVPRTAGVFSENERRLLIENNIPLNDSLEDLACHEKYLAYCALTCCSDRLTVSGYMSDYSGNTYEPSVIAGEINRLFPNHKSLTWIDYNEYDFLYSEYQAFECLAKNYGDSSAKTAALKKYFSEAAGYADFIKKINTALENRPFKIENTATAEKLFNKNMNISASQIEKYSLCPFQYFCNYGLRARQRKTASIDAVQFGNIVHYFMEKFLKEHRKEVLNTLSDSDIKSSIDSILLDFANENFGGIEDKPESFLNLFERLKGNILTLIKQIIRQLEYSDFVPVDFELKIGADGEIPAYRVQLDGDRSVSVNGFIDRVDILDKNDDESYIRIIDYKTGNKTFKLSEILYGVNMQMLIYLLAVVKNGGKYYGKKLLPCGILYMPSAAKDIDGYKFDDLDKIANQLDKNFAMNGLVLNDPQVLNHMDRNGKFIKLSKTTEDGKFSDTVATNQQLQYIFKHIDDTIRSMGRELLNGNIPAMPLKGIEDGCAYCPYDSVCCHKPGDSYKFRQSASPKEVYKNLGMEAEKDDE